MKTVILCGGRGTRIRDVADDIPKPMIPVGGLPILWHLMKYYAHWGHHEFILCLGHKAEVIKDFFLNYKTRTSDFTLTLGRGQDIQFHTKNQESDWRVTLVDTGQDAMTGARIRKVERYLDGDEPFFLTYGDGLSNVDLGKLLAFHQSHGRL
jgi:glucose-1-phosphate cytidylyltransferase